MSPILAIRLPLSFLRCLSAHVAVGAAAACLLVSPLHADVVVTNSAQITDLSGTPADPTTTTSTDSLVIGFNATGELLIDNTTDGNGLTSVTNSLGAIGLNIGSMGMVTVTGAGSTWNNNSSNLLVGFLGTGTLDIENSGAVTVGSTTSINSTSTLNLNTDGTLDTGSFEVAAGGTFNHTGGTLTVHGGTLTGVPTTINGPDNPTIVLDNASLAVGQGITVGDTDRGTLRIENGGTVSSGFGTIGDASGVGTVTVTGANSMWTNGGLGVGGASPQNGGNGTLIVEAGGAVITNFTGTSFIVSEYFGSIKGKVTVTGVGSTWQINGRLLIGRYQGDGMFTSRGPGELIISDSGVVSITDGHISNQALDEGSVTVTGDGSTWNNANLSVGQQSGSFGNIPVLNVGPGGTVNVTNTLSIWDRARVNLNGGVIATRDLRFGSVTGEFGTINFNSGTLHLTNGFDPGSPVNMVLNRIFGDLQHLTAGQTLQVTGTTTINLGNTLVLNGGTWTTDTVVAGTDAVLFNTGTFNLLGESLLVGGAGQFGQTLTLRPGMAVNVTNDAGDVAADGQLLINGSTASFSAASGTNYGTVSVIDGSLTYTNPMTQTSTGTMNLVNATVTGGVTVDPGSQVFVANTATFNEANQGDTFVNNGEVNVGGTATFDIDVSGNGNFTGTGTNQFNKNFSPGNSPGQVNVDGDVTLTETATLVLELAGTTLGVDYDHLDIAGLFTADGTLDIKLLNNFAPQLGDTFDLLDFNLITGSFDAINLPTLASGLSFDTTSLLTIGVISVVPEPATLTLFSLGCLLLARRRVA